MSWFRVMLIQSLYVYEVGLLQKKKKKKKREKKEEEELTHNERNMLAVRFSR